MFRLLAVGRGGQTHVGVGVWFLLVKEYLSISLVFMRFPVAQ